MGELKNYLYTRGVNEVLDQEFEQGIAKGKVKLGENTIFWKKGLRWYGVKIEQVERIYRRVEEVKSKLCCGSANFDIQKLMLQRLNIPTIDVKKVKNFEKDSNHYWLLVSIDQGETYYHFDNVWSRQLCLVTDKTLDQFSKYKDNCFNRDKSLYPATPTESLPESKLPWNDPKIMNAKP